MLHCCCCCRYKANCSHAGPGPKKECPPWEVFLGDPNPYLREFRRKSRKNKMKGQVGKHDIELNPAPPVYQFECRTARPLVGSCS